LVSLIAGTLNNPGNKLKPKGYNKDKEKLTIVSLIK
jgi:hypothetical protein